MNARKVRIDTSYYGFVHHPRTPRGYGLWWFETMDGEQQFQHHGMYGDAAAAARRWAASLNINTIRVAS